MSYGVEDEDIDSSSTKYYFRCARSTFFTRVKTYFADELTALYNTIDSSCWNAENSIAEFDTWQDQFPEELWRLDYERKYLRTFTGDTFSGEKDEQFLRDMMNGKKKYQRRQFLRDQEIYMASKFPRTTGFTNYVQLRCSAPTSVAIAPSYVMNITPYSDLYINVMQGQKLVSHLRAKAGTEYSIQVAPEDTQNIDFIYIQCANRIQSLGDMSKLYLSFCSIGNATKLQKLILGNSNTKYANPSLQTLGIGANTLLEYVDIRNMTALQDSLDFSNCPHLKELYATGTQITGIVFPNGGEVTVAELPAVSSLVMKNLSQLTTLSLASFANLQSLVIENCEVINTYNFIKNATALTTLRLTGIDWDSSYSIGDTSILERLYGLRGYDSTLSTIAKAVVAGYFYATIVKESDYHKFTSAWTDITIEYSSFVEQYAVTFVNDDGTVLDVQYVDKGGNPVDPIKRTDNPIDTPTKEPTVDKVYTYNGWDTSLSTAVFAPKTIKATYAESVREYTVSYAVNGRVVESYTSPYGSSVTYAGDTPTYTAEEAAYVYYLFSGWDKNGYVDGDKTINAVFDRFTYTDGAFDSMDASTMTPVQFYALMKFGATQIQNVIQIKDKISFNMGYDYNYSDVTTETIFSESQTFSGSNYQDTDVHLLNEDKDWVLAVDYEFTGTSGTLMQCYQMDGDNGFRVMYSNGYTRIFWGSTSYANIQSSRDMLVLRHVKGESTLYVYIGNMPSSEITISTLTANRAYATNDPTLVFGCRKADDGVMESYATGVIHWAKVWYGDLGDDACQNLAFWTHEKIELEAAAFRYYLCSDGTRTNVTWLASKLLEEKLPLTASDTNTGGWASASLNTFLNDRFYKAIPISWRQLIKKARINSSIGDQSSEVSRSDCYVEIPAIGELTTNDQFTTAPYNSEGGTLDSNVISYMTTDSARVRSINGTADTYLTRSPNYKYSTYWWMIGSDGKISGFNYTPSQKNGVLIELSF